MKTIKTLPPSSDAREEFLAVLEYLFEYAYDEKHLSRSKDIIEFAQKKYNLYLRRERVAGILSHLEQLYNENPERFPFKLYVKKNLKGSKYYITNRYFSDLEVIDIITALRSDHSKSKTKINKLENKLLNLVASVDKQKILMAKLGKTLSRGVHISEREEGTLNALRGIAYKKMSIKFKLELWYEFEITDKAWASVSKDITSNATLTGYVHSILYFDRWTLVVFYLKDYKAAVVAPIESIVLVSRPLEVDENITFEIEDPKYHTVDEWLKDLYTGKTYKQTNILLGVYSESIKKIQGSFESYFDTPLVLEDKSKGYIEIDNKQISVKEDFEYIKITCNVASFNNWFYNDRDILSNVVVIEPNNLNKDIDKMLITRMLILRANAGLSNDEILESINVVKNK